MNRRFKLKSRPSGMVSRENFDFVTEPVPELGPDQALVRNCYLSLDPTNRIWMTDMPQYMSPVAIGEVMRGGAIGKVIASNSSAYKKGDIVAGLLGWQDYCVISKSMPLKPTVLPKGLPVPLSAMLGVAGMTGITAYFGLLDIGKPRPGETLVVSAAAGATGSVAGQIGKIKGCRVVGIAGSDEKCEWLTKELGFDAAINYKKPDWKERLKAACPNGVDISFENVGGEIMTTVLGMLNLHARVVLCGLISSYNEHDESKTSANLAPMLMKRVKIQGFIIIDYAKRFHRAVIEIALWLVQGKLKHKETVIDGLEHAPEALIKLFEGENLGKLLIKITDPATIN